MRPYSIVLLTGLVASLVHAQPPAQTSFTGLRPQSLFKAPPSNAKLGPDECPHMAGEFATRVFTALSTSAGHRATYITPSVAAEGITLAGTIQNVPEYHDCQRLIERTGTWGAYGPLAAIYVRDTSIAFTEVAQGKVAAAVIVADYRYAELGIRGGANCLYIIGTGDRFTGYIRPVGVQEKRCLLPFGRPTPDDFRMDVRHESGLAKVPHSARWDMDVDTRRNVPAFACGVAWCTLVPQGTPATVLNRWNGNGVSSAERNILRGIGWWDEQPLAISSFGLRPSTRGTVVPSPRAAEYTQAEFAGIWQHVATVYLERRTGPYREKYAWDATAHPGASSRVRGIKGVRLELCDNKAGNCPDVPPTLSCVYRPEPDGAKMIGRYVGLADRTVYVCVRAYRHTGKPHGLVRFKWRPDDETIWVRCPLGCCEADRDENGFSQ